MSNGEFLEVRATIAAPLDQVWEKWTQAAHVVNWNFAHESWCCPRAQVDFCVGGTSSYRMEAKDGSFGFDFAGTYTKVIDRNLLEYAFGDRMASVAFQQEAECVRVTVTFDAENEHPADMQQQGWQAILDNFKRHVEGLQSVPL